MTACTAHDPIPRVPCITHVSGSSRSTCVACFTADVLQLAYNIEPKTIKNNLDKLEKRFKSLAPRGEDLDLCNSVIQALNTQLLAGKAKLLFGSTPVLDPDTITWEHRQLYRDGLRRMGTWVGFTEFGVLARMFGVRFYIAYPSQQRLRRVEVGNPYDRLIANPALLWTGNHYQVATLQAHGNDGQYTANNVIATNGRGDCGLEAFLLMLHGIHPALQLGPLPTDNDRVRRSVIRSFARTYLAPRVDGLLNTDDVHYVSALTDLRNLLADTLTNAEIDDAIVAEGALPESEEERSKKKLTKGSMIAVPVVDFDGDPAQLPWQQPFAITTKKIGQAGFHQLNIARFGNTNVRIVGGNCDLSDDLWQGSLDFLADILPRSKGGGYDQDSAAYFEQVDREQLLFVDNEGRGMKPRSTHFCSCLAAITLENKTTHYFLFGGVNFRPGSGKLARAQVSTLRKGESGTHSEKYCLGLLAQVLRGFGLKLPDKILAPVNDCVAVTSQGAALASTVAQVDVAFMNIAEMCITCQGYWAQFRDALLDLGVPAVRCYNWYFITDIKKWK